ncbi:MAG: NosD domain-containing protein [Candidatus Thermoplasmatota archaeon]|nr:NosD domain-containing protein [Candidatus Thermoplasmatota archaeon]
MKQKTLVIILITLLSINCIYSLISTNNCTADILPKFYVDDDYDSSTPGWHIDHFNKIQDAINNASAGDRIIVYRGTYDEKLTINKKLDVFGESRDIVIINWGGSGDVITINTQYVNISHFTIKNSGSNKGNAIVKINYGNSIITDNIISDGKIGIFVNNSNNNLIYDNIITNNDGDGIQLKQSNNNDITYNNITNNSNGIFFYSSSSNTIENNVIQDNSDNGVFLSQTSNDNTIMYNNISGNSRNGIYLHDHCDYTKKISNNQIYSNGDSGIRIENSSFTFEISNNIIVSNTNYGIMIVGSSNKIQTNIVEFNKKHGIFLFADDNNTISDNIINGNTYDGIRLYNSTDDTIYGNKIYANSGYGVYMDFFTTSNLVYNNLFYDNTHNAYDTSISRNNSWYKQKTTGTNILQQTYIGGNYWDDYTGSDNDIDGFGDTPYIIHGNNKDELPIVDTTAPMITSVEAKPSSVKTGGYIYISAIVTDNSQEVSAVYLNITKPDGKTIGFPITQNKTGTTYYCNKAYAAVGTYKFYIKAKDARNNWKSTSTSQEYFEIIEGTPPTVTDKSPTTGSPGNKYTFNASVKDDSDDPSNLTVKVCWNHGTLGGTQVLKNTNGNYFVLDVTLDKTLSKMSYYFIANDTSGNIVQTARKNVTMIDKEPPEISINKYGQSFAALPNSYTYEATITDNHEVSKVTIEYWYEGSEHVTVDMDKEDENNYKKIIIPPGAPSQLYCVIYATDVSGNKNDTKRPFADANGPYHGVVASEITFNGTGSFDLDGSIVSYSWSFGDGTTGTGVSPKHTYSTNGNYTVTLTVTDNEGKTGSDTTYVNISEFIQTKTTPEILEYLNNKYSINLTELFYSFDSDGDGVQDGFYDPNDVLKSTHTGRINISGDICFLISINDTIIPEFIWNITENKIVLVSHVSCSIIDVIEDKDEDSATVKVKAQKTNGWIFFDVEDKFPKATQLVVKKNDVLINSDRFWRKNNKVCVLDDPETEYQLIYNDITPPTPGLDHAVFIPPSGSRISKDNPNITISYASPVEIVYVDFYNINSLEGITTGDGNLILFTDDNKTFSFTPPGTLESGNYRLDVLVKDQNNNRVGDTAYYTFVSYIVSEEGIKFSWLWIALFGGVAIAFAVLLFFAFKYKLFKVESFIYVRNKKILPFFKPVIFGPFTLDIDDKRVSKAEFYVNGKLKDTVTKEPFTMKWDEKAFMKQTIEAKVYDEYGNSSTTGEMTFFVFNLPKFFK